jgi:hypothetical protein
MKPHPRVKATRHERSQLLLVAGLAGLIFGVGAALFQLSMDSGPLWISVVSGIVAGAIFGVGMGWFVARTWRRAGGVSTARALSEPFAQGHCLRTRIRNSGRNFSTARKAMRKAPRTTPLSSVLPRSCSLSQGSWGHCRNSASWRGWVPFSLGGWPSIRHSTRDCGAIASVLCASSSHHPKPRGMV